MTKHITLTIALAAALPLLAAGCAAEHDDGNDLEVAEQAATSSEASGDILYVAGYFDVEARTAGGAIAEASAAIEADVTLPLCVSIDTDGLTYLDATFTQCVSARGFLIIDGSLHAELSVGGGGLTYTLSTEDLSLNLATVTGQWQVTHPFDDAEPSTWSGSTEIHGPARSVSMSSTASWRIDGDCIDYSIEAQIDRPAGTGTMVAEDVHRCMGECPASGTVTFDYALGGSLSWTYNGDGTATVTGSAGHTFTVALMCSY